MSKPNEIGHIVKTPAEYDEDGNVITAAEYSTEYHVNALQKIYGADEYLIPTPDTPVRIYAGVPKEDTYFYAFPDEATFRELVPEPEPDVI